MDALGEKLEAVLFALDKIKLAMRVGGGQDQGRGQAQSLKKNTVK